MVGCDVVAKYKSADVHIGPASRTGRLRIVSNAVAREVILSDENRVTAADISIVFRRRRARLARNLWLSAAHACRVSLCF